MSAADEIHIFANLSAAPGKADEMREVLKELVAVTKTEPGVISYILHEDPKNLGHFYFFEAYKNEAAVEAHRGSAHIAAAFGKLGPILGGAPSITATKVLAGS
jgi:quinol monooxygenase YgiN